LQAIGKAAQLSPRDSHIAGNLGIGYWHQRRFADAEQQLARTLAIDPEDTIAKDSIVLLRLYGRGDATGARAAFDSPPAWTFMLTIAGSGESGGGDINVLLGWRVYPDLFERHFDAALRILDKAPVKSDDDRLVQNLSRATIRLLGGDRQAARAECSRFAPRVAELGAKYPDSLAYLLVASWSNVCLGRNAEAIAAARHAAELTPASKDAYIRGDYLAGLAEVDAQAGAPDEALKLIEQLLAMPAGNVMTIERLKRDPVFDPLRGDARLQKLIGNAAK
jgi:tetratricopeptide (TPR) repeat protein